MGKTQFKNKETKKKSHSIDGINSELLSLQGMYMIRFHSFYPWHSHSNYMNLCNDKDLQMLPWVQEFKLASLSLSLKYTAWLSIATSSRPSILLPSTANLTCTPRPPSCPTLRSWSRTTSHWSTSTVPEYWSFESGRVETSWVRFNGFYHWAMHCIISSPLKLKFLSNQHKKSLL